MTYLEKAMELHPSWARDLIVGGYCPWHLGLEKSEHCIVECEPCWNREMPNTQNKTEEEEKL